MIAKELIEILSIDPNAEVMAIHTQYDGDSDQSTVEDVQIVATSGAFVVVTKNYYDKKAAIDSLVFLHSSDIRKLANLEDPLIIV